MTIKGVIDKIVGQEGESIETRREEREKDAKLNKEQNCLQVLVCLRENARLPQATSTHYSYCLFCLLQFQSIVRTFIIHPPWIIFDWPLEPLQLEPN